MASKSMKSIKVVEAGKTELRKVTLPALRDDYVLCRVRNVALNPTDWKHIDFMPTPGATVGCDFAGVVEEIGPAVLKEWKKGDRIAGFLHGSNAVQQEDGCFAEYCVAKGDLQMKIPDNLNDQDASTLGVGITTVGQALYQSLGLSVPGQEQAAVSLLINGGSTATGTLAIQYALLSGCQVVTTCSPHNFEFVKRLGVAEAFDYTDPECGNNIRAYTNDRLMHAFDCISEGPSPQICCDAISSKGGAISYLLPVQHSRQDVDNKLTLAYTITGESFKFGTTDYKAVSEDLEFGKMFWDMTTKLFASGQLVSHPSKMCLGGLNGIAGGLQQLREGKISGKKLVYKVSRS